MKPNTDACAQTWGEFEHDIMAEIIEWTLVTGRKFNSARQMIEAFWEERLK